MTATTNNRGLGKGLGALMSMFEEDMEEIKSAEKNHATKKRAEPQNDDTPIVPRGTSPAATTSGAAEIDVALIDNNTAQPRRTFNPDEMRELEQSISAHGVLQPILLKKVGTRYMIIAGERRWRAARAVGLKTIPALVRDFTPKQIAEVSLVENLMRADLNEIEIAVGIKKLMDTYMMTQEQVSMVLGKSRSAVANSLRLLNLPSEIQTMLEQKQITLGHAKCLAGVADKTQMLALAKKCASGAMTVRELESITAGRSFDKKLPAPKMQSVELKEFASALTRVFATRVVVQGDDHHGKIVIEYNGLRDLERIKSKLK